MVDEQIDRKSDEKKVRKSDGLIGGPSDRQKVRRTGRKSIRWANWWTSKKQKVS